MPDDVFSARFSNLCEIGCPVAAHRLMNNAVFLPQGFTGNITRSRASVDEQPLRLEIGQS